MFSGSVFQILEIKITVEIRIIVETLFRFRFISNKAKGTCNWNGSCIRRRLSCLCKKYVFTQNDANLTAFFCPRFRNSRNILFVFRAAALCTPAEPSIRAGYTDWFRNHWPVKQVDCSGEGMKKKRNKMRKKQDRFSETANDKILKKPLYLNELITDVYLRVKRMRVSSMSAPFQVCYPRKRIFTSRK